MAQGDFLQFGVAVPIINPKFRIPTYYTSSIVGVDASNNIIVSDEYSDVDNIFQVGDRITVTNSSGSQSENLVISAISDNGDSTTDITCGSAPTILSVGGGGSIAGKGSKLAAGWARTNTGTQRIRPLGIRPYGADQRDNYGQVFKQGSQQSGTSGIGQPIDKDDLENFTYYRFGGMFKHDLDQNAGDTPLFYWDMSDGVGFLPIKTIGTAANDVLSWTRISFDSNPVLTRKVTGSPIQRFLLNMRGTQFNKGTVFIDEIFLEHARGTTSISRIKRVNTVGGPDTRTIAIYGVIGSSPGQFNISAGDSVVVNDGTNYTVLTVTVAQSGQSSFVAQVVDGTYTALVQDSEVQVKNDGYFQLQEYPVFGSVSYEKIGTLKTGMTADNAGYLFNPVSDGDRTGRWIFSCSFSLVSQINFDKLRVLLDWQNMGNMINFHPFIDDLPNVMTGRLSIRNPRKPHWSLALHDFDLVFEELVI